MSDKRSKEQEKIRPEDKSLTSTTLLLNCLTTIHLSPLRSNFLALTRLTNTSEPTGKTRFLALLSNLTFEISLAFMSFLVFGSIGEEGR